MTNRFVIFTDLDGTLLDHGSYCVRMSVPGIDLLVRRKCPVIPVSSKTSAEIRQWMKMLFLNGPFICENGCGIIIPKDVLEKEPPGGVDNGSEWKISLGLTVEEVRRCLREISAEAGVRYRGFDQMTDEEISGNTGLKGGELGLSRQREYDEPFIVEDESALEVIGPLAASRGLMITKGGRFYHATGGCDKGKAVKNLADLLRRQNPGIQTIAIGDSQNDLPMFKEVDRAYLVQKPDGSHDPSVPESAAKRVPAIGPKGFRAVIEEILTVG